MKLETRRLGRFFPWPLVGTAAVLVVLILLTPALVSSGSPAAGSLLTQAELIVDRAPGSNITHFYVRGLGVVRYASISIGLVTGQNWSSLAAAPRPWANWTNGTDVIELGAPTTSNPVAINVTAHYVYGTGSALYVGVFAFNVTSTTLEIRSFTSAIGPLGPEPLSNLPLTILLAATVTVT